MKINDLIEERARVKNDIDTINKTLKNLMARKDELDVELMKKMDAEGLSRTANAYASVSINEDTVPDVTDWDKLYEHVINTGEFSLIQRRVSSTAYRELLKMGEAVPGLEPRTVRKINFRSL